MRQEEKSVQLWIIAFAVVIVIGLVSTMSLFFYSFTDFGTIISEQIELDNATVALWKNDEDRMIKLTFSDIREETTENYTVSLLNKRGKVLKSFDTVIEYSYENMKEYEYKVDFDLDDIYYYKIEKNPD
jgi:hypothetical protein